MRGSIRFFWQCRSPGKELSSSMSVGSIASSTENKLFRSTTTSMLLSRCLPGCMNAAGRAMPLLGMN